MWISPAEALAELEAKRRVILFPTRLNLMMLDESRTAVEAIAAARERPIRTVEPWIAERDGKQWLTIRNDAGYALTETVIERRR